MKRTVLESSGNRQSCSDNRGRPEAAELVKRRRI